MAAYNPRNFDLGQFMNDLCQLLQTHINFPRFLPISPDFLEQLSHLAPIH
jgi:hypothetical protein